MTTLPSSRTIAAHEAAHAAAALTLGVPLVCVRTDYPRGDLAGLVRINWEAADLTDLDDLFRRVLIVTLMGPISEGRTPGAHHWPLNHDDFPTACGIDIDKAITLAERLRLDAVTFGQIAHDAHTLWRNPDVRGLAVKIARELEEKELLLPHELEAIHKEALQ